MRLLTLLVLLAMLTSACASEDQSAEQPTRESPAAVNSLPGFAGKTSDEVMQQAGLAMDQVRTFRFRGFLTRDGERTAVNIYSFPSAGCKGRLANKRGKTDIIVFLPDGAYSRREGKSWRLHKPDSSPYRSYCSAGDAVKLVKNQKDTEALIGQNALSPDGKYVRVVYGKVGEVWVAIKSPHHVHRIIGPGMDLTFSNFDVAEPIEAPAKVLIEDPAAGSSLGVSVK